MNNRFVAAGAVIIVALVALFFALRSNPGGATQNLVTSPMAAGSTAVTPTPEATSNSEVTVQVTASGFDPQTVTVKAGTKVTWMNNSGQTVSINSNPHPIHTDYPPLNLGRVDDGGSVSLVFDKPGSYGYHNHLQPSQTGEIIVQ